MKVTMKYCIVTGITPHYGAKYRKRGEKSPKQSCK